MLVAGDMTDRGSRAAISSADGSGFFFAVMSFSVVVITAPSPLTLVSALGRKHR
jgi:hypothetical protein